MVHSCVPSLSVVTIVTRKTKVFASLVYEVVIDVLYLGYDIIKSHLRRQNVAAASPSIMGDGGLRQTASATTSGLERYERSRLKQNKSSK